MAEQWVMRMFEPDREWLQDQPGMTPWQRGCAMMVNLLKQWLCKYSKDCCCRVVQPVHQQYRIFVGRMWGCWRYHWRQGVEDSPEGRVAGEEVADRIRSGQGYRAGGRLGGDPLRDIVLAVAMQAKDGRATKVFQEQYYDYLTGVAGKLNKRFFLDPDDWWNDFLVFLAGTIKPPGKLERFEGRCALRSWLPVVLWNFLRRRLQTENRCKELPGDGGQKGRQKIQKSDVTNDPAFRECVRLFATVAARAIRDLPAEHHLLLTLIYVERLKQKDVAAVLGVHPGTITRRRDVAAQHFGDLMEQHATRMGCRDGYRECLEFLGKDPKVFADALRKFFENEDGSPGG